MKDYTVTVTDLDEDKPSETYTIPAENVTGAYFIADALYRSRIGGEPNILFVNN